MSLDASVVQSLPQFGSRLPLTDLKLRVYRGEDIRGRFVKRRQRAGGSRFIPPHADAAAAIEARSLQCALAAEAKPLGAGKRDHHLLRSAGTRTLHYNGSQLGMGCWFLRCCIGSSPTLAVW